MRKGEHHGSTTLLEEDLGKGNAGSYGTGRLGRTACRLPGKAYQTCCAAAAWQDWRAALRPWVRRDCGDVCRAVVRQQYRGRGGGPGRARQEGLGYLAIKT